MGRNDSQGVNAAKRRKTPHCGDLRPANSANPYRGLRNAARDGFEGVDMWDGFAARHDLRAFYIKNVLGQEVV
jgi:hypothetical protein